MITIKFNNQEIQFNPDAPFCPRCGGQMYDNRKTKKNYAAPDFRCKNSQCTDEKGYVTGVWMPKAKTGGGKGGGYNKKNEKWMAAESAFKSAALIFEGTADSKLPQFKKLAREIYKEITSEEMSMMGASETAGNAPVSGPTGQSTRTVAPQSQQPQENMSFGPETLDEKFVRLAGNQGYQTEHELNLLMTTIACRKVKNWRAEQPDIKQKAIDRLETDVPF